MELATWSSHPLRGGSATSTPRSRGRCGTSSPESFCIPGRSRSMSGWTGRHRPQGRSPHPRRGPTRSPSAKQPITTAPFRLIPYNRYPRPVAPRREILRNWGRARCSLLLGRSRRFRRPGLLRGPLLAGQASGRLLPRGGTTRHGDDGVVRPMRGRMVLGHFNEGGVARAVAREE